MMVPPVAPNLLGIPMESIRKKIYYFAKKGLATALRDFLSTINQKDDVVRNILSQLVEEDGQRSTPLIIAARCGHEQAVRALLKYSPDLEQEGSVKFDDYAIDGANALWCAAGAGHLGVVKVLVRAGANVNHTTRTNSTPVRAACFDGRLDIVKYLTDHNADIHITNKYNNTCLMIAAYKGHLNIVNFLLELGANPNEKANCGATALHFAGECGHVEIVKALLNSGAEIAKNESGMTPIISAAERVVPDIVEYFVAGDVISEIEKIDALELLGASYASDKDNYNLQKSYYYLRQAMERRYSDPDHIIEKVLDPPLPAYGYHQESRSLEELQVLEDVPGRLHMEALVIRQRILGPHNPEVPPSIIFRGAVYADNARFDKCLQLWQHAMQLKLDTNTPIVKDLLRFAQVFSQMVHVGVELDVTVVLSVLESTVCELQRNHAILASPGPKDDVDVVKEELEQNMITSLYLIMVALRICKHHQQPVSQFGYSAAVNNAEERHNHYDDRDAALPNFPALPRYNENSPSNNHNNNPMAWREVVVGHLDGFFLGNLTTASKNSASEAVHDRTELSELEMRLHTAVYRLLKTCSRTRQGRSLLHLAVSPDTPVDDFHTNLICRFPCASTTKLLITCGASVNDLDNDCNTPLHLIVAYTKPISDFLTLHNIILSLVDAGAHMDIVNSSGATPFDNTATGVAGIILRTQSNVSLQCLASRVIVANDLPYQGIVPRHLEQFIKLHGAVKGSSSSSSAATALSLQL